MPPFDEKKKARSKLVSQHLAEAFRLSLLRQGQHVIMKSIEDEYPLAHHDYWMLDANGQLVGKVECKESKHRIYMDIDPTYNTHCVKFDGMLREVAGLNIPSYLLIGFLNGCHYCDITKLDRSKLQIRELWGREDRNWSKDRQRSICIPVEHFKLYSPWQLHLQ